MIKYKQGKENVVADALSQRYVLLTQLQTKLLGFELIKDFMPVMQISAKCGMHVISVLLRTFIGMRGICSRRINFVCLEGLCVNG